MRTFITALALVALALTALPADFPATAKNSLIFPAVYIAPPMFLLGAGIEIAGSAITITGYPQPPILDIAFLTSTTGAYFATGLRIAFPEEEIPALDPFIGAGFHINNTLGLQIRLSYQTGLQGLISIFFRF